VSLQPGNTLGNYQIVEKIGAGGMGSVYKAYQPSLGRYVAIKVLPPQTAGDPTFAERFAQEARAVGKLRHPNIVTAFDFTQQDDIAYLVSDYIDGGTLADQLGTPLPLDYAMGILGPIAAALDYAHARGIVHRDIKPQNVLMTREGTPVLTDFGLAKIVGPGSGMTQAGSLMGTADYMAPELAGGAEGAGPAADQYALGIIAYQILVGRHPFPSDNPLSALMAHVNKPVPLPSQLGVVLPPGAEAALIRALAKKPEDRFSSAREIREALMAVQQQLAPSDATLANLITVLPDDEAGRLAALERLEILDTDPEQEFDDLARLASHVCETPFALISFVDRDREWFKAKVGIPQSSFPRLLGFGVHAIGGRDSLVVADAAADARFAANPLVTGEPGVRFFAAVPIRTPDGYGVGTLAVLDRTSRELTDGQLESLRALSRQVMAQLELRRRRRSEREQSSEKLILEVAGLVERDRGATPPPKPQ